VLLHPGAVPAAVVPVSGFAGKEDTRRVSGLT